jgi:hypothetical protein
MRRWRLAAVLVAVTAGRAGAHSFAPGLFDVREQAGGRLRMLWRAPAGSLAAPVPPSHCRVEWDVPPAAGEVTRATLDCGTEGLRGATLAVRDLTRTEDALLRITWHDGAVTTALLRGGADTFVVPASRLGAGVSPVGVLGSYLRLGIEHILRGADHLLFVLGLLLLAGTWSMLVRTVTAFTVAHSLTLALATLRLVEVPPAPIEALIAASIVLLASELARDAGARPTLTRRAPWLVAFLFGLVHGLGFAGALADAGLPADHVPLALLAFNAGVECGQLAFVAVAAGPLWRLGHRVRGPRWLARLPAHAMGALAVAWTIDRVLGFWAVGP